MSMRSSSSSFILASLLACFAFSVGVGCDKKKDDASADEDGKDKKKKKKDDDGDDKADKKKDKDGDKADKKDDKKDKDGDKDAKKDGDKDAKKDGDKKDGDKKDDDKKAPPAPGGAFAANIEGTDLKFKSGKASVLGGQIHVELSTEEKSPCGYVTPSDDSYQVKFDLSPGPGGKFFAGGKIGTTGSMNSPRVKLKMGYIYGWQLSVKVDPFKLEAGAKVKGSLDFDIKYNELKADTSKKDWFYKGAGDFDVELCDDKYDKFKKLEALPETAPAGDVEGTFAGEKFKYKTAIANVWHDKSNDVDYVQSIEFYPEDATCTNRWDLWKKANYFKVDSIGGTSSKQKFTGHPQPASPSFSMPKPAPGGKSTMGSYKSFGGFYSNKAWVQFEKLSYKGGDTITGSVVAKSGSGAKTDETGEIGGKFEAKVCASGF